MGYKEIYQRYTQSILAGTLKPGEKVPSIRVLAEDLGVAKKTVEAAYDILIGEGYLVSRGARGTLVNPELFIKKQPAETPQLVLEDKSLKQIIDLRDNKGYFRLGIPSLDEFPYKKWLLLSGKAIRAMRPEEMLNPPIMGHPPLRQAIANYLNISRGLNCKPEQIFITSGYKSSIALILQTLSVQNDKCIFEDPGYFFGQKLLKRIVHNLHYAPVDAQGLNVDYLLQHHHDAKFVITSPAHHSPLAVTLSLPRRQQLLHDLAHYGRVIDDHDFNSHCSISLLNALGMVAPRRTQTSPLNRSKRSTRWPSPPTSQALINKPASLTQARAMATFWLPISWLCGASGPSNTREPPNTLTSASANNKPCARACWVSQSHASRP